MSEIDWTPTIAIKRISVMVFIFGALLGGFVLYETMTYEADIEAVPISGEVYFARFNKPDDLYVYEPTEIKLVISADGMKTFDLFGGFANLSGEVQKKKLSKLKKFLTANLSSPKSMMEIDSIGNHMQEATKSDDVIFSWFIKPLDVGSIPIRLEIYTQDKPDASSPSLSVQVLQQNWDVHARGMNWVKYQINNVEPIRAFLWTTIGGVGAVATFFGFKMLFTGKKASSNDVS